ncbi:MAG: diacylglycerol kinase catalytic region [Frankiales bacterium]|nr:diacylglycerol kinase catalytic region [Frankiales bacterium]
MSRRLQLVVNPAAGGGRASRLLPGVEAALRAAGHELRVTPTRSLEHADELAAGAVEDERVVVAMGGDGLVGRVAGVVSQAGGLLGVVPGGRGNDFCRAVGIDQDPVAACRLLMTGTERAVDLGVVTSPDGAQSVFLGIASIGFDSDVQERVLTSRLPLGGLVYVYGALATVARWRHAHFTGTADGVPFDVTGWTAAVANSGVYGGGMRLAPEASVTDGRLDLVTSAATSRRAFLSAMPEVFKGTHVARPSVQVRPVQTVTLDADRPFRVFADGDPVGTLPCTVTVRAGALRVLLPG